MSKKKNMSPSVDHYAVPPKGGSKTTTPKWLYDYVDANTPTMKKSPNKGAIPNRLPNKSNPYPPKKR